MNREQTIAAITVMQGYVEGKAIEYTDPVTGEWTSLSKYSVDETPVWAWSTVEYRVKPEPRVIYINEYSGSMESDWIIHPDPSVASQNANNHVIRTSKWIEVLV